MLDLRFGAVTAGTDWVAFGGVAQLIAAGATVILATITALMAKRTKDSVKVARQSLEATFQPLLVPVVDRDFENHYPLQGFDVSVSAMLQAEPRCWIGPDQNEYQRFFTTIPVRNVGLGPASFGQNRSNITFTAHFSDVKQLDGRPSSPVVVPGDIVDLVFHGAADDFAQMMTNPDPDTDRRVTIYITYTDVSRVKETMTRLELEWTRESLLKVTEVTVDP